MSRPRHRGPAGAEGEPPEGHPRCKTWGPSTGADNPCKGIRRFRERSRDRVLDYDEEVRLFAALPVSLHPVTRLALECRARLRSELLSLRWDALDLDRQQVTIRAEYAKNGKSRVLPRRNPTPGDGAAAKLVISQAEPRRRSEARSTIQGQAVGRLLEGGVTMRGMRRGAMALLLAGALLSGCSTAPVTQEDRTELVQEATDALAQMVAVDPGVDSLIRRGHGYALFPAVVKGGLVLGGGYGRGVVYEQGQHIGYASLAQASFGLQVGGHSYRELIVFETKAALDRFRENRLDFTADAEAVLADGGPTANAQFIDGIVVVIAPRSGAMAQAAIGGQQITYVPK